MSNETRDSGHEVPSCTESNAHFVWPLSKSSAPDEMNTSFGPHIDADRWDFHDGIDLPASVGTPVHTMADGMVHRAGPADKTPADETEPARGFGSTHVLLQVCDPTDGQNDLFLVYLHLDSIAEGVISGAQVNQGDVIGTVGQEDATYPHLYFEFRKGEPKEDNSVHPLHYLDYPNTANFTQLRLDWREGDLQGIDVELKGEGIDSRTLHVDFDDRKTIVSDKGDQHAFKNGIAVEGYQKSNLKGEDLNDLHYGVLVKDIAPEYECVELQVLDVKSGQPKSAEFSLPKLKADETPVNSRVGFEVQTFPPQGWELNLLPGNVCRPDAAAALTGSGGLLCQDLRSLQGTLIRAGLRFPLPVDRLPVRPMSWRLKADTKPEELQMDEGLAIHPLAFLAGDDLAAAACLRKIGRDNLVAGVLIRSAEGLFRERIDVTEGQISTDSQVRWELDLLRLGTRQTTAVLRLDGNVVARINGNTTSVEPDTGCVGILHRHSGLQITLHVDQLLLTEALR